MLIQGRRVSVDTFASGTGWTIEPWGACNGDVCVPLPSGALDGDQVEVDVVAERLGMAVIDGGADTGLAVGPATCSGTALASVQAPDLLLETFDGEPFRLGSLRGTRHVLVAWAPY